MTEINEKEVDVSIEVEAVTDDSCPFPEAEKRFVRRMDRRIMPILSLMYFFSALDRSNIGNAKVAGMNKDIGINDSQYSTAVSIVYATYLPFMLPGVLIMLRFFDNKKRQYLGCMVASWSIVTIFTLFVDSYGSLIACRLLLGLCEASFFSSISVIISNFYFQSELSQRTAYLFAASAFSSAFGGLIGTGITKIQSGKLASWKYIYLIEGLLSFFSSFWIYFGMPNNPEEIVHGEEEAKALAWRSERRHLFIMADGDKKTEALSAIKDVKLYLSTLIQFCGDVLMYGFSTFLPSILQSDLGYDSLKSQYLTVPVYIFAGIIFVVFARISDKTRIRGPMIVGLYTFGVVGYALLLANTSSGVKYFACYLICFCLYLPGMNESWIATNSAPQFKRAVSIGVNQSLGNIAGVISPQVYRKSPKYTLGHAFTLGCIVVAMIAASISSLMLVKRNRENAKVLKSGVDNRGLKRTIGDDAPDFNFVI
ncbi:hypothetical protein OGAPHI_006854 [Ogataea philodendri]|uniref:Major facilitator superfamily (MFS) profile domain-containing protein n=1 Tax=Ogataea philodendri TaxID=1378263 RepID=A0A9P8NXV1_9ASCO|nr:uncharacterized protein OGAPHI_006854 [Ogataea philodendri]KAH3661447.1 hypothetical protein OGAPHI_006854 [Ogataea philodendri]